MPESFSVSDCNMVLLPDVISYEGSMIAVRNGIDIPFEIERVYYLYDIPGGASRGGHAHKKLEQLLVAITGSFDVTLDDGRNKRMVQLNRSNSALHLRPGIWREINNFSSGAICLVLASRKYDEGDYIRNYEEFKTSYGADRT